MFLGRWNVEICKRPLSRVYRGITLNMGHAWCIVFNARKPIWTHIWTVTQGVGYILLEEILHGRGTPKVNRGLTGDTSYEGEAIMAKGSVERRQSGKRRWKRETISGTKREAEKLLA